MEIELAGVTSAIYFLEGARLTHETLKDPNFRLEPRI